MHHAHDDSATVRSTCPYCGVGCGVVVTRGEHGPVVTGDPEHPANFGRLCSKGSALAETLAPETRLLHPHVEGARATWDAALDRIACDLSRIVSEHGPDAVAFYLSGQLLTEDYYVANKLMKGFIGSGNVDTNSRLCMSSSVAGHKRVFGSDTVPGCYEDLDEADAIVLVGSNAAWCHPVLYRRIEAAMARGAKLVVIDPRRTETCTDDTLHLPVAPGMDGVLFSGLLVHLADTGALDHDYIAAHTENFAATLARAREIAPDVATVARRTDVTSEKIATFYALFRDTPRVVTCYSQGVNQSAQGTDKVAAILACHLATGRIGKPGCGPFSLTGQPNAMGGREVGGLANQLAAHMDFSPESIDRVGRFWAATRMATRDGLKAVDLFDAVADGRVKALWVMGTNPAVSLPKADAVRAALGQLELFVVSDVVASNDTLGARPHVVLPALAWGEKDGTVTNSERRISRQRGFLAPIGEARPDWWAMCEVAKRLGYGFAFSYASAADIFREHAALSAFENDGTRDFDLGGLADLSRTQYETLAPVQWPLRAGDGAGTPRLFGNGRFFTASGKARFVPIVDPARAEEVSTEWPLLLNTGRVRDHWHTMTRTGLSPRLAAHVGEPFVAVHSEVARRFELADGGLARVTNARGRALLRVVVTDAQRPREIFAPIHWSDEVAASARVGALVHDAVDPFSGQPDAKATPVAVAPETRGRTGFVLARRRVRLDGDSFWAWQALDDGFATRLETDARADEVLAPLRAAFPHAREVMRYEDPGRDVTRVALLEEGRLVAVVFLAPAGATLSWTPLLEAWGACRLDTAQRRAVLAGRAASADAGPAVCACFGVRQAAIEAAIVAGAASTGEIGARLKAGTNCGSCLPEIRKLLGRVVEVA